MKLNLLINDVCIIHLVISFFGFFCGLALILLFTFYIDYPLYEQLGFTILTYSGISGVLLGFTSKYWEVSVKRTSQSQDSVK